VSEGEASGDDKPRGSKHPLLVESSSLLEEAQALANLGTWVFDLGTDEVFWSRATYQIFGREPGSTVNLNSYYGAVHADDLARVRTKIRQTLDSDSNSWELEHRLVRPDGTVRWVFGRARITRDGQGKARRVIGVVQDVTERKWALEELRASEDRARRRAALVEWSREAIIGIEPSGVITSWNSGASRLLGYSEAEVLGKSFSLLVPDGLRAEATRATERVACGESVEQETIWRCKDGTKIEVALVMSPIRDADGQVVGISKIARDLTDQRKAERALRRAEQQLREAQKMEAVGLLAGGIAHDFNNLLSAIVGYTELVLDTLPQGDPIRSDIIEVRKAGASAVSLTRQLLALSRRQVLQPRVIDLNQVVSNLERMLRRLIGPDVNMNFELASELGRVSADPGQIEQVIMNLVLNARDAIVDAASDPQASSSVEGTLTISSTNVWLDNTASEALLVAPGEYVSLAITDTGVGMDEATIARIFEPFFTTKEKGKGTGLGLSTALGIVQQSGGAIGLDSRPGHGTTFRLYLPRTQRALQGMYSVPPARLSHRSWETILLVEDDDQVRTLARTALRRQGYQVLEAEHGQQALDLCEQHVGNIHLMLTDVVMPRMGGRELAERVAALRPDTKILFMSGYANDDILTRGILTDEVTLLQKPITPSNLARKVREVLDTP
jgi:two-component system, cell cycle sensor histidine kinase and response regulator CckA